MIKKTHIRNIVVLILCMFILNGCGVSQDNEDVLLDVDVQETEVEESTQKAADDKSNPEAFVEEDVAFEDYGPEELLDAFLASEILAIYENEEERIIMFNELPIDENDWFSYSVGERIDLDNDGENEQILNGPYGGIYLDARDGKVYVLAEGKGTTGGLFYTDYDNAIWIVHCDTTHAGRQMYWLTRYDGGGNVVDEFMLGAEYWDSPDDKYDENSDFTYRDEKISMEEYEELKKEILGIGKLEIPEGNGIIEIYADGDIIAVPDELMIAQVLPKKILKGNPIIYDQFRIDGWVFEWLISDYHAEGEKFSEDGVLVVSRESDMEDSQIIHVEAEGGDGVWISVESKFEYGDVNFDNIPDLLICTGHHGNQGLLTYYCFLQTEKGFVEAPTFTDIPNPAIDAKNKLILSQWRNSAASHSWAEYKYQDSEYVMHRELCEELEHSGDKEVWVWTVNGKEAARSDELSEEEIAEFLYGENSEWKITGDRWRTLYNNGLTTDYSIYAEP